MFRDDSMVPSLIKGVEMYDLEAPNADKYFKMEEEEIAVSTIFFKVVFNILFFASFYTN